MVPGTLCTADVFGPLLSCLGVSVSCRRTLMPDRPTIEAYAPRIADLMRPGSFACGFSLGSIVLAHNLAALPDARAVVLIALNPLADAPGNHVARRQTRDRIRAGEAARWIEEGWHRMSESQDESLRGVVIDMARQTEHLIDAQTELAVSRPSAEAALVSTDVPLVFVTGSRDPMTPSGPVVDIARRACRAHVTVLDGLGHFALLEAPERVAAAIKTGLNDVLEGGYCATN